MSEIEQRELGEVQREAEAAAAMLNSEVFNVAFQGMNRQIIDQILTSPPEAKEERERLYMMFKAGQVFVQQFATMINNLELRKQPQDN
jgi:DNA-binding TFAR19-related protein (PDSD5 family)